MPCQRHVEAMWLSRGCHVGKRVPPADVATHMAVGHMPRGTTQVVTCGTTNDWVSEFAGLARRLRGCSVVRLSPRFRVQSLACDPSQSLVWLKRVLEACVALSD
ncbi:hypothetical protein Tco_0847918 [Tanacetum coccineum]